LTESRERNGLGSRLSPFDAKYGERELRLAPLVGGASGIEEEKVAVVFEEWDVGVSKDDDPGFGEAALHSVSAASPRAGVVDHRHTNSSEI
jgi:hypothetical protein